MNQPAAPARSIPRWAWAVIVVLLAAGLAGFWVASLVGDDGEDPAVSGRHPAVEALIPARGSEVLQQQTVGIDLSAPYELSSLVIRPSASPGGGVEVIGEADRTAGLNQYLFSPGPGQSIEALSPDTNCAVAVFALIARRADTASVEWCFEVS